MSGTEAVLNTLTGIDRGRNPSWQDRALCKGDTEDIWFPQPPNSQYDKPAVERPVTALGAPRKDGEPNRARVPGPRAVYAEKVAFAVSICQECPVRLSCYEDAISRNEQYGIWGGVDFYKPKPHKKYPPGAYPKKKRERVA